MFAPFSPEENGIRGYPQGYGIRENALKSFLEGAQLQSCPFEEFEARVMG